MGKGESHKIGRFGAGARAVAPTPAHVGIAEGTLGAGPEGIVGVAVVEGAPSVPAPPRPPLGPPTLGPAPPRPPLGPPTLASVAAATFDHGRPPEFTSAAPTPPRPPIPRPPEPPRPPATPVLGTGGVTATVTSLEPKGLRARLRRVKPRNLAIAGAVAASVLAAAAVVGVLLLGSPGDADHPAVYAFDSDAVRNVVDGMSSSVSPRDTTGPGDPNALWNYDVAPSTPNESSGTSKYMPPYRSGSSGKFIPYTPPYGSSGSSGPSGDGGKGAETAGPVPQAMAAGSYSYSGSGTLPAKFWSNVVAVPATVAATVTAADAGCSALALGAGGNTVSSTYCVSGGALSAGPRTRAVQNGVLTMTCSGPLLPAGAQSSGATRVDCKASAGALSEDLSGSASVADAGGAWVATTDVSAATGDRWTEHVTIDKASGRVVLLQSDVRIALLVYQESSSFTLR